MRALVVLCVHGLHGYDADFNNFEAGLLDQFSELVPNSDCIYIQKSKDNGGLSTIEGLKILGSRLVKETVGWFQDELFRSLVEQCKSRNDTMCEIYFAVVAHSLGGLISRYALRTLIGRDVGAGVSGEDAVALEIVESTQSLWNVVELFNKKDSGITFDLTPFSYMSVCTPHAGSRRAQRPTFIGKMWPRLLETYCSYFMGLTGQELFLLDWEFETSSPGSPDSTPVAKLPIVWRMAKKDGPFMKALKEFPVTTLVACLNNDIPVGYCSAAATSVHPHPHLVTQKCTANEVQVISVSNFFEQEFDGINDAEIEIRNKTIDGTHPRVAKFFTHHLLFNNRTPREIQKVHYDAIEALPAPGIPDVIVEEVEEFVQELVDSSANAIQSVDKSVTHLVDTVSAGFTSLVQQLRATTKAASLLTSKSKPSSETSSTKSTPVVAREDTVRRILTRRTKDSSGSRGSKSEPEIDRKATVKSVAESEYAVDSLREALVPRELLMELHATMENWRRINLHFSSTNSFGIAATHALAIGKDIPFLPAEVRELGRISAYLLSRIVIIDYKVKVVESAGTAKVDDKMVNLSEPINSDHDVELTDKNERVVESAPGEDLKEAGSKLTEEIVSGH